MHAQLFRGKEAVEELRHTTNLALRATKQTAALIGQSMVATEGYLWVNLTDIGERDKKVILFDTSVETVLRKFGEAKVRSAAFKTFISCQSRSILDWHAVCEGVWLVPVSGPETRFLVTL